MALQTVYWLALGVGLGMLALSLVFGGLFDFADFELGGTDLAIGPMFFTAMSAFGAGGLIGIEAFGFGQGGSIVTGIATGAGAGALTGVFFAALRRQEAGEGFELSMLVGQRGRCTLATGPGKVGRVTVSYEGMSRAFAASSGEEIASGEEVVVTDVIGSQLTVARPQGGPAGG